MKLTENEAAALYREATARRERGPDCLDDDLLLRASGNTLGAAERERIAAHIAQCSNCARDYRVALSMRGFRADARAVLGGRTPAWWAAVAAAAAIIVVIGAYAWRTAATLADVRRALAAAQGAAASARNELARARLQARPARAGLPQLGVPIVDLDPEPMRGAAPAPATIDVPPGTNECALVLHLPPRVRPPVAVSIVAADGAMLWTGTAARGIDAGTITVTVPRDLIPSGRYAVRVDGCDFPFGVTWR